MPLLPGSGRRAAMVPAPPPGRPIATFRSYLEAQAAVDFLSDEKFAVQNVSIVGTDLKMVERVTGRLTYGRVALGGALTGAYFGGFVGLLLALFDSQAGLSILLPAMLMGVAFGVIFGVISYAATGGRRDFTSTSQIVAAQYAVWCVDEVAGEALQVLARMPGADIRPPQAAPQVPQYEPGQPVSGPTYSERRAPPRAAAAPRARGQSDSPERRGDGPPA